MRKFLGWLHAVGRIDDGASARGSSKQRGIAKQKIETGCVLVFALRYSHQSVQYIRGLNRTVNGLQH